MTIVGEWLAASAVAALVVGAFVAPKIFPAVDPDPRPICDPGRLETGTDGTTVITFTCETLPVPVVLQEGSPRLPSPPTTSDVEVQVEAAPVEPWRWTFPEEDLLAPF